MIAGIAGIARSIMEVSTIDDAHSFATSFVRGTRGLLVTSECRQNPPRPDKPLEVFEFEACPYCRKVREAMSELDLSFIIRTCGKGAIKNRSDLKERGGKAQFPYLVDPNTGTEAYESEEIVDYLAETYGGGRTAMGKLISPVNTGFAMVASAVRPYGRMVRPGLEEREQPPELLVLYNFEASPYCRKVRETLCELNLDYLVNNVAKGSTRRARLKELGGKVMVPYLVDPNTDVEMYESDEIIGYLEERYG